MSFNFLKSFIKSPVSILEQQGLVHHNILEPTCSGHILLKNDRLKIAFKSKESCYLMSEKQIYVDSTECTPELRDVVKKSIRNIEILVNPFMPQTISSTPKKTNNEQVKWTLKLLCHEHISEVTNRFGMVIKPVVEVYGNYLSKEDLIKIEDQVHELVLKTENLVKRKLSRLEITDAYVF